MKYSIVTNVVAHWPTEAVASVRTELQMLVTSSGIHGADLTALRLLIEHDLAERAWLEEWSRNKVKRLRELLDQSAEIERLLAR